MSLTAAAAMRQRSYINSAGSLLLTRVRARQFSVALRFHCSSDPAVVNAVVGRRTSNCSFTFLCTIAAVSSSGSQPRRAFSNRHLATFWSVSREAEKARCYASAQFRRPMMVGGSCRSPRASRLSSRWLAHQSAGPRIRLAAAVMNPNSCSISPRNARICSATERFAFLSRCSIAQRTAA